MPVVGAQLIETPQASEKVFSTCNSNLSPQSSLEAAGRPWKEKEKLLFAFFPPLTTHWCDKDDPWWELWL